MYENTLERVTSLVNVMFGKLDIFDGSIFGGIIYWTRGIAYI